ncbi:hypothetical protein H0G86_012171 [Trichoderma simmonsii]|uniref:Uncharacterized protein n=1 Tax=Trichoderma simmonsii TaxID=1491479 RepID=A0A8G0LN00_9HYPO|nr:hypothetical protein H0G86_012171 [Trichoderma simmonsii]
MKVTTVLSILAVASSAAAEGCRRGLTYCGSSLLAHGNYHEQINEALKRGGKPTDSHHILDSLFFCTSDEDYVVWEAICKPRECYDAGPGNSDHCIGEPEDETQEL